MITRLSLATTHGIHMKTLTNCLALPHRGIHHSTTTLGMTMCRTQKKATYPGCNGQAPVAYTSLEYLFAQVLGTAMVLRTSILSTHSSPQYLARRRTCVVVPIDQANEELLLPLANTGLRLDSEALAAHYRRVLPDKALRVPHVFTLATPTTHSLRRRPLTISLAFSHL